MDGIHLTYLLRKRLKKSISFIIIKKIHETALNLKEPKIYDLPNRNELSLLIEQYAKQKKLLWL